MTIAHPLFTNGNVPCSCWTGGYATGAAFLSIRAKAFVVGYLLVKQDKRQSSCQGKKRIDYPIANPESVSTVRLFYIYKKARQWRLLSFQVTLSSGWPKETLMNKYNFYYIVTQKLSKMFWSLNLVQLIARGFKSHDKSSWQCLTKIRHAIVVKQSLGSATVCLWIFVVSSVCPSCFIIGGLFRDTSLCKVCFNFFKVQ